MNKFAIPTILIATILVAGILALMPMDKASTVHATIQGSQLNEAGTVTADMFSTDLENDNITITSTRDFMVFCQTFNGVGEAQVLTILDTGDGEATNDFDMFDPSDLAFQWAADADDTVVISSGGAVDGLCTALTTTDGVITFE